MIKYLKSGLMCLAMASMTCMAAPQSADAGPVLTFGPEDQGLMKLEYKGQFQLNYRDEGIVLTGDNVEDVKEFNFRRNRLAIMGAWGPNFGLYVQTEFNEDNNINPFAVTDGDNNTFHILDAVFRFKMSDQLNVWAGKFKYNLTRENLEACEAPLTLDRSFLIRAPLVDEGTRDKGVAVWGNFFDNMVQYRVDAMNGRNDSASSPDSNFRYSARGHISLLEPEMGYGYKGTYLGEKKVFTIGAAYQMENDVAFSADGDAVDYSAWTADLFLEYPVEEMGTFTFSAAYVDYDLENAYQGANLPLDVIGINGEKNGGYIKAGYMMPNLPLQFFARAENWSFTNLYNVFDQEVDWYGAGFNYYFRGQDLKLTVEVSQADFDTEGITDGIETEDFTTATAQLQVIF